MRKESSVCLREDQGAEPLKEGERNSKENCPLKQEILWHTYKSTRLTNGDCDGEIAPRRGNMSIGYSMTSAEIGVWNKGHGECNLIKCIDSSFHTHMLCKYYILLMLSGDWLNIDLSF